MGSNRKKKHSSINNTITYNIEYTTSATN